jgi:hypothetical protein
MGADPQIPLAHCNEGGQMPNPIGIQMLQLDFVITEETAEK